ncbi:MAG TPA: hypothetical protein VIK80_06145 [Flavihumibacter sp.]
MKQQIILAGLAWIILSAACTKVHEEPTNGDLPKEDPTEEVVAPGGFQTYTIPAGEHYSLENGVKPVTGTGMAFEVIFDSSCIYRTRDPRNQDDINKLMGFSDNGAHQTNSARFGWRWKEDAIELLAYVYNDGTMRYRLLAALKIGEPADLKLSIRTGYYEFSVNGETTLMPRTPTGSSINGYMLYPYFGGDETAPHTVKVAIKMK